VGRVVAVAEALDERRSIVVVPAVGRSGPVFTDY
jgi:hypothetical protein